MSPTHSKLSLNCPQYFHSSIIYLPRVLEFLKGATVRSRKIFQSLHKIWVFGGKNGQFIKILKPIFGPFCIFCWWCFDNFVCAKLSGRNFGHAKNLLLESLPKLSARCSNYVPARKSVHTYYLSPSGVQRPSKWLSLTLSVVKLHSEWTKIHILENIFKKSQRRHLIPRCVWIVAPITKKPLSWAPNAKLQCTQHTVHFNNEWKKTTHPRKYSQKIYPVTCNL